ncbi:RICIN domain-containing protein [Desertivirga arenae]|uniref:RICIN domain-containing protein n=1 Tax=Desertivirga arenae TaxID=2810309 RepID=UPI001A974A6A|nr:RICIN domain-containing protein [Pedobacter sp. SYSU D00823]
MRHKPLSILISCIFLLLAGTSCKKTVQLNAEEPEEVIHSAKGGSSKTLAIYHVGGILHTDADFERMKVKVNAGAQPWKGSWDKLLASPHSSATWTSRATATIIRGGTGDNVGLLYNDVAAAYQNALIYRVSGNTANGNKARDILNHWSSTLTSIGGNADRFLAAGIFGYQLANAGEMMRNYSGFNVTNFSNMLVNIFYPMNNQFLVNHNDACITNYWANWDLCNMASVLAIGIFADDQAKIDQAVNYFKTGAGNGSILKAVPFVHAGGLGQWQESGRDQGHAQLGVGLMGAICEMAWNQGIDLYSYSSSRFMQGAEYVARYNNGNSVPFTTYNWGSGQNCAPQSHTVVSEAGRGEIRPIYEMVYGHYAGRMGLTVTNVAERAAIHRPEGGPGGHATTFDQPGYGSLTFYRDASSRPIANGTYSLQNRATGKMLDNAGSTVDGANVKQYPDGTSNNQKWTVSYSNGYYKLSCVTGGKCLDSYNNTANGSTVHQWANGSSPNQQWQIIDLGNGYFKIFNRANGKCLDTGGGTADGTNMQFWNSGTSNNQQWAFVAP